MSHEIARAEQPNLFEIESDKHDATLWFLSRGRQRAGRLDHHGYARSIVVRARIKHPVPDAEVIIMGRHDHPFFAQGRVGPAQDGSHVASLHARWLSSRGGYLLYELALKQRLELEPAKFVDEKGRGLSTPLASPALHLWRAKGFHHGLEPVLFRLSRRLGQAGTCAPSATAMRVPIKSVWDSRPPPADRGLVGPGPARRVSGTIVIRGKSGTSQPIGSSGITGLGRGKKIRENPARARIVWHVFLGLGMASLHGGGTCREAQRSRH